MSASGYTNELAVPDLVREVGALRKRVEELERRAIRMSDGPPPDPGCCTSYCCSEQPFDSLEVGEVGTYCTVDPDPIGGEGMRLDVSGWVTISVIDSGFIAVRVYVTVDGTEYLASPGWGHTMTAGDSFSIPYGTTVDSPIADPTVDVNVQNLNTPTIQVFSVYRSLWVSPEDGSTACGDPAGQ